MPTNQTILITGAGSGIGRAIAEHQAEQGARLVLVGRRAKPLEEVAAVCLRAGSSVLTLTADVTKMGEVDSAVQAAVHEFGRLDAVVNNAGVAFYGSFESSKLEDLDTMLDIHVKGTVNCIRAALPHLRQSKGCVVNVGSAAGTIAAPGRAFYGLSKAAVHHLTRSLAREFAPDVRVNAIVLGPIETPIMENLHISPEQAAALYKATVANTPMGRFGDVQHAARWVGYLLDPQNSWLTGSLLSVDGGRTA